jgi:hypothetical protein
MDGGHRIHALLEFKKNQAYMLLGNDHVYYKHLSDDEKEHFEDQDLQFLEYTNLPIKDEINQYIMLNSGLPFSLGEKLASVVQVNSVVKTDHIIASQVALHREEETRDLIPKLCQILKKDSNAQKGRKNELLIATFCVYNLWFRLKKLSTGHARDDAKPMFTTIAEQFVQVISEENIEESKVISRAEADVAAAEVLALMHRAMTLYHAITQGDSVGARKRTGQTDYRRMIVCLLAVADITDLDDDMFCKFVEATHAHERSKKKTSVAYRTLTTQAGISKCEAQCLKQAYHDFVASERA